MPQTKKDEIITRLERMEKKIDESKSELITLQKKGGAKAEANRLLYLIPLALGFNLLATLGANLLKTPGEVFLGQLLAGFVLFAFGGWQFYRYTRS
ncbi:MAG: hypothetical protein NTW48_07325 [Chloroflexi bacterium]|jgi:hypothetical protein|nr:hypothetical protein [Chloroflexota bacterium]